ncbi:hypothetical protein EDB85DRAFT_1888741 [Lactarius pseudohatsudake]|nr:hypothetical protein EDB85DRAFT_1888741 [Lactarius pseudohatsudake]
MIDAHQGIVPLTEEEAVHRLKEAWARENANKIIAWNAQLKQDQAEQDKRDRLVQEAEDAQHAQHEKEAEEQCREAKKKKPKMNTFDPCRCGCREAAADSSKLIGQDTLAFTQLDDMIALCLMAAVKPSRYLKNNEDLTWDELMEAKNSMLHLAKLGVWLLANAQSLAAFLVTLEVHPIHIESNG